MNPFDQPFENVSHITVWSVFIYCVKLCNSMQLYAKLCTTRSTFQNVETVYGLESLMCKIPVFPPPLEKNINEGKKKNFDDVETRYV